MSKYKKGLVEDIKREQAFDAKQLSLKEKYNITDKNIVVVEKNRFFKYFFKWLSSIFHTVSNLLLVLLAIIGVLVLIYPSTRSALFAVLRDIWNQLVQFIPALNTLL